MQAGLLHRSKHFTLQQLSDGIYAALAADGGAAICNAGLFDLGGKTVVFDTFLTPQAALDLRRMAEELFGRRPPIVVNSHYHNDHVWGNQAYAPEAQIVSSTRTRELLATAGKEELEWFSANSAKKLESIRQQIQNKEDEQQRSQLGMWVGYYEGLVEAMPHLAVCLPSITFDDRLALYGSKDTAELITFQGAHTESDTILHLPREGIVFMSDLLFVGCHPYLADGDPHQLLKALNEISQLDATQFVPGHGAVGTSNDVRDLIDYVEYCLETAQRLVKAGDPLENRMAELQVAERYRHWRFSEFFQANMRFLCQRLNTAEGDKSADQQ